MQDPSIYSQMQFPEQEHLKCPRCDSANTKFCYYNNYNLSQPRHFCKNCRRYWTKGGALRNIPVGGGSRKNNTKRSSSTAKRSSSSSASAPPSSSPPSSSSSLSPSTTNQPPAKTAPCGPGPGPVAVQPGSGQGRRMNPDASAGGGGSYCSLSSSSGGQFGNLVEGLHPNGSNLELCGFGDPDPIQDPGLGLHNGSNSEDEF